MPISNDVAVMGAQATSKNEIGLFFSSLLVDDKWVETARIRAPVGISYFGGSVALAGGHVILFSETSLYSYFLSCI